MEDHETETLNRLSEELQVAALNLIQHVRTHHVRMRIEGTTPELYITLSEGRHAVDDDATGFRAEQEAYVAAAQDNSLYSFFARLRKSLEA